MYKDLAKWLIGFVPVTTIITLGVALAPSAAEIDEVGLKTWFEDNQFTFVAVLAVLAAMLAMVGTCSWVLLTEPSELKTLKENTDWMSRAFSHYAVGGARFLDSGKFADAELDVQSKPALAQPVQDVLERIVGLSAELNARDRLKKFLWVYAIGIFVVVAGVLTVLVTSSGGSEVFTQPTAVAIHVPAEATVRFTAATGCTAPAEIVAVAVGGTRSDPDLRLFGAGCATDEWSDTGSLGILITG